MFKTHTQIYQHFDNFELTSSMVRLCDLTQLVDLTLYAVQQVQKQTALNEFVLINTNVIKITLKNEMIKPTFLFNHFSL